MLRFAPCLLSIALILPTARAAQDAGGFGPSPGWGEDDASDGDTNDGLSSFWTRDPNSRFSSFWTRHFPEDQPVLLPWDEWFRRPTTTTNLVEALVRPDVSGDELAAKAELFHELWQQHMRERTKVASLLAELAALYEKDGRYAEALALYERVWDEFPEQQKLIAEIKREHAVAKVEIDLSTPEAAFTSLKRALLTYKLTAATFGVTGADTILYHPEPIEQSELEASMAQHRAEAESSDGQPDRKAIDQWPEPEPEPWRYATKLLWSNASTLSGEAISINVKDQTLLEAVEKLRRATAFPITITPTAKTELQKREVSLHFKGAPPSVALRVLLEKADGRVHVAYRPFHLLLYCPTLDEPEPLVTNVVQFEPWGRFPDDVEPVPEPAGRPSREILRFCFGLDAIPAHWFIYMSHCVVVTAPLDAVEDTLGTWSAWGVGVYYGRVDPLLRCLRGYPLPGPPVPRHNHAPGQWYTYVVQLDWQVRRMHHFLSRRLDVAMLLQANLVGYEERAPGRFRPNLGFKGATGIAYRLGLWRDGDNYRFLVFDSIQDRERWLDGEDWLDVPSDLDQFIKDTYGEQPTDAAQEEEEEQEKDEEQQE